MAQAFIPPEQGPYAEILENNLKITYATPSPNILTVCIQVDHPLVQGLQQQAEMFYHAIQQQQAQQFPEMQGLSPRSLGYMKAFAEAWPEEPILQQLVAKLPWGHNVRLLDLVKNPEERLWYAEQTIPFPGRHRSATSKGDSLHTCASFSSSWA